MPLVPTRNGEAPLLAAQRRRWAVRIGVIVTAFRVLMVFLLAGAVAAPFAKAEEAQELDLQIAKFLDAMQFAPTLKRSAVDAVKLPGRSSSFLQAVIDAPDQQIIDSVAPIFRSHLTLKDATEIASFYSSESMKAITRQQATDPYNPDPTLHLTPQQKADYDEFIASDAGAVAARLLAFIQSPSFMQQVNERLSATLRTQIE